jgi:hypothetical protein
MSSLTSAQFSFLVQQEKLIAFGLGNVFHGACDCSLIHMRLMFHYQLGVYTTLVAFLVYFFCQCLDYSHNHSMPNSNFH